MAEGRFGVGDPVNVLSRAKGRWMRDGVVVSVLAEDAFVEDGTLRMPAGACKVQYDRNRCAKWIPPISLEAEIRPADFEKDDAVSVFCRSMGRWVADGVVLDVWTCPQAL
mmetsp:Transcript_76363/g.247170  ORF Transcript_76363/g.247170 Transcript_76363/m.247170 type:complete len:110 (+) Transcript_76363:140-469(+)